MAAGSSDGNLINLEVVTQDTYLFMDVGATQEPQEDALPISPSPTDEEYPPGSSHENRSDDEEEEVGSEGRRLHRDVYDMTILDIDDELADDEVPLSPQNPLRIFLLELNACRPHCSTSKAIDYAAAGCGLAPEDHLATGSSAHTLPLRL